MNSGRLALGWGCLTVGSASVAVVSVCAPPATPLAVLIAVVLFAVGLVILRRN